MKTINVLITGVGGQGTILAGKILAKCALDSGFDVKSNELHGMAQRGGSVTCHVRFGDKVFSPMIPTGEADFMLAMEELEALRYLSHMKKTGYIVMNKRNIMPSSLEKKTDAYPKDIQKKIENLDFKIKALVAHKIALECGSIKIENIVLLGVLSKQLPIKENIWHAVITTAVPPKTIDMNLAAFKCGQAI
ncbi:MAG: hypothetical protein A2452_05305 [Candidatus Firestonebacteria bacterium RIFOXYC2_FULL_39_67]|nr:MAG: hypothetical protein A2536_10135 [Candidatus Firestonebacteria bacterium RIFOXYD2_FULL_39_29]OGF54032.1 MAG: hypothetical protein A2497_08800 [Candidatus Firestonebacteria bacterium RifOxyC12_full_39_7]OGF56358.1 MAG: hypothetical protein A2452_05305 [Candidatus Firestonebacteria bacterium RIFOXYC2_FULL_39_67]